MKTTTIVRYIYKNKMIEAIEGAAGQYYANIFELNGDNAPTGEPIAVVKHQRSIKTICKAAEQQIRYGC